MTQDVLYIQPLIGNSFLAEVKSCNHMVPQGNFKHAISGLFLPVLSLIVISVFLPWSWFEEFLTVQMWLSAGVLLMINKRDLADIQERERIHEKQNI